MKKQLFLILLTTSIIATAQNNTAFEETESQKQTTEFLNKKRHYLSLDINAVLVYPAFSLRYEYAVNTHSSIGGDLSLNLDNNYGSKELEKFSFSPFYRQYFFSEEDYGAKGFYGEGFLKFYTFESSDYFYDNAIEGQNIKSFFETAVGVSIGWKQVFNSGLIFDTNIGLGRNLGFSDVPFGEDLTERMSLNIGWRF